MNEEIYKCAAVRCSGEMCNGAPKSRFLAAPGADPICPDCGADAFPVNDRMWPEVWLRCRGCDEPISQHDSVELSINESSVSYCVSCVQAVQLRLETFKLILDHSRVKVKDVTEFSRAQQNAVIDYENNLGKTHETKHLKGLLRGEGVEVSLGTPVLVRVIETDLGSLTQETSGCIDPIWYVELVNKEDAKHPDLKDVRSLCMYAQSYDADSGEPLSD